MKVEDATTYLSATDLVIHMYCKHATWLNLRAAQGLIKAPHRHDPSLIALQKKGEELEKNFIQELKADGQKVAEITRGTESAAADTAAAMRQGADVIYQARLEYDTWNGWADFLMKVEKPGGLGNWSYEVLDTKLSRETKTGAILQISLYSEILEKLQGVRPEFMHIKNPAGKYTYRVDDFGAYYHLMKADLLQAIEHPEEIYPDIVLYCDVCRWWAICNQQRRHDDYLGFIAGIRTLQMRDMKKRGINTLELMANLSTPLSQKPDRGSAETLEKLIHQAQLQLKSRVEHQPIFEILPLQEGFGFYQLPEPSSFDIFFDFEGDPFVGHGGLEYLFGWYHQNDYHQLWAKNEIEEKQALERFMDEVMQLLNEHPEMHIYHYGAYEQTALKRLVGKYVTKEDELDQLLRAHVFVNLHTITRQSIIAGVESYSLKDLEKLHGFARTIDLKLLSEQKLLYEGLLESGYADTADEATVSVVRDYNKDDCLSAKYLRDWLTKLRQNEIEKGKVIPRPVFEESQASENIEEHLQKIKPLFDALMADVPPEKENRNAEQQVKYLLANMLDWYRREDKSFWWEYYKLKELSDEDLLEEKAAISMLEFTGKTKSVKRSIVSYYQYPEQEFEVEVGKKVKFRGESAGTLDSIDKINRIIGLKREARQQPQHPIHIVQLETPPYKEKQNAIIRLAEWVVKNGITGAGNYKAGRELLLRSLPNFLHNGKQFTDAQEEAIDRAQHMNESVLPIQGPPGTGKSHTAACMILALVKSGKKIGICALSHKVITGLLDKVFDAAAGENTMIRIVQKVKEVTDNRKSNWEQVTENSDVEDRINGTQVIAGTSYMWAREEFFQTVDYLFVDEAGQLSLIDTLAISHAGKNLVLLGDPQQLKQPQKGSHPEGTDVSALEHTLQNQKTIYDEQGVFLNKTWRMHPAISSYISELFYDNRLETIPETVNQKLEGNTKYAKPGIYVESVKHYGNQSSSIEEINKVISIVNELLNKDVSCINRDGSSHKLSAADIKIIAPYNAQVNALTRLLPQIQIGTVDKFQGQEAPVIIFSMTTSSPEDAPRGMEFLYSLNRLNVAVSRAKTVFILVASPALFEPLCRSVEQMKMANALCRLREMAQALV